MLGHYSSNNWADSINYNSRCDGNLHRESSIPHLYLLGTAGGSISTHAAFNWWNVNVTSGSIADQTIYFGYPGNSAQATEGAIGITMDGYGPFKFDNNYIVGSAISGIFMAQGLTQSTTPCGWTNPCTVQTIIGNLTVTRNTMTTNTDKFFYDSPDWDGGNRYWRNLNENKTGRYTLYDGNIIGPWFAQVGEGQCGLHEDFAGGFIQVGSYPPYGDASDWTFINNTCLNMPSTSMGTAYPFGGYIVYPYPIKNFLIQNDLFLNNNAYAQTAINQPFDAYVKVVNDQTSVQCPQGIMSGWYPQENVVMDHITVSGQGGCQSFINYLNLDFPSMTITNSVLNFVNDPGVSSYNTGIAYNMQGYSPGTCVTSYTPKGVWPCINNFTWAGNVVLPTWTNSIPGSQVDFTTAQITGSVEPNFTGYATNFPTANTLGGRQGLPTASGGNPTSIGWLNVSSWKFPAG